MPIEIDILGQSCDVVKLGNLLKSALIQFPVSVLISSDSARFSLALLVKTFRHVKLRSPPSLGRTQKKKTLLWQDVGVDTKKPVLTLSAVTDEEDHILENEDEFGRRLCEY